MFVHLTVGFWKEEEEKEGGREEGVCRMGLE